MLDTTLLARIDGREVLKLLTRTRCRVADGRIGTIRYITLSRLVGVHFAGDDERSVSEHVASDVVVLP